MKDETETGYWFDSRWKKHCRRLPAAPFTRQPRTRNVQPRVRRAVCIVDVSPDSGNSWNQKLNLSIRSHIIQTWLDFRATRLSLSRMTMEHMLLMSRRFR